MDTDTLTDEQIVCFLDGNVSAQEAKTIAEARAADPVLDARIRALSADIESLRDAMNGLLVTAPPMVVPQPSNHTSRWNAVQMVAAAMALLAVGLAAGAMLNPFSRDAGWHVAVADYHELYTAETLTGVPVEAQMRQAGLAFVSDRLKLELNEQQLAVDGMTFQRAQMLEFQGKPLAQLAYLERSGVPVALCIMHRLGSAVGFSSEQFGELNAVVWSQGEFDFILIGALNPEMLNASAHALAERISG